MTQRLLVRLGSIFRFILKYAELSFRNVPDARYQAGMLRQLSFVSGDTTVVGSYHIVTMGQVYKSTILDALVGQIEKVRHGGIAIVHGVWNGAVPLKTKKLTSAFTFCLERLISSYTRKRRIQGFPAISWVLGCA